MEHHWKKTQRERHIWTTRGHTLFFTENEMAFLLLFSFSIPFTLIILFFLQMVELGCQKQASKQNP